ncbi:hypothetical protein PDJAM_G00144070 [Pangasius djambal]|uniref:Uncharacterized protein n=1 Tax=Pangasius djambal TaxID=1691987 RepID=A0ACC5ZGB2_9TELE|nr:hypothetical protein [Pangasius djambal]
MASSPHLMSLLILVLSSHVMLTNALRLWGLRAAGLSGDALGNRPDPYVKVWCDGLFGGTTELYSFPSLELRGPNLFQHDDAPVHKASSMKTWCVKVGVEELECPSQIPDLNPTEHLWDELEYWEGREREREFEHFGCCTQYFTKADKTMTFSSSPRLVYLTVFILVCLALPSDAALRVYLLQGKGLKGDALGNAPDPYVKMYVRNTFVGQTSVIKNSSNPLWSSILISNTAQISNELKLQVWDKDVQHDDLLGVCYAQVKRGSYTYKCTLSKGGYLTYSYEFK